MTYVITGKEKRHIFDRHYQFCVGSGHAPLALRTDYVAQLKRVHEELGIERVRFHGIFDEDMKVVPPEELSSDAGDGKIQRRLV